MKRRLCSYDMAEVPAESFVLFDHGGEMYFCNLRCLAVWSVQFATKPNLSDEQRSGPYILKTTAGLNYGVHSERNTTAAPSSTPFSSVETRRGRRTQDDFGQAHFPIPIPRHNR